MDTLSWIALVQPLVLVSIYSAVKYAWREEEDEPVEKFNEHLEGRVNILESRYYVTTEGIQKLEKEIETLRQSLSERLQKEDDQQHIDKSGEERSKHQVSDGIFDICLVCLASIQLVIAVIVMVLWCKVNARKIIQVKEATKHLNDLNKNTLDNSTSDGINGKEIE